MLPLEIITILDPMGLSPRIGAALAALLGASLVVPAAGHGTVTIGSSLSRAPAPSVKCAMFGGCTMVQGTLPQGLQAPGGLVSPVNGTVTQWRVRTGTPTTPAALSVIRRLGDPLSASTGTSASVTPPTNSISSHPAQLPIAIGETIGLDCCLSVDGAYVILDAGTTAGLFRPPLAAGGSAGAPVQASTEVALNAEIEPIAAFSLDRAKAKKKARVRVTATLPNPGTFQAGDRLKTKTGATAAARKHRSKRLLKSADARAGAPGKLSLTLKPTKAALARLARKAERKGKRARIKVKVRLAFTPTFGSPSVQVVAVSLKR
jgi:hypothetical protein